MTKKERKELSKLEIISIDPNKDDLIYCLSGSREDNNFRTFRYTNNQRCKETRSRKHKKILQHEKEMSQFVTDQELVLSECSNKSVDITAFTEYVRKKNLLNEKIKDFYERTLWRKLRLSTFVRKNKSEMEMLNRFKETLGSPDEAFVAFGDWSTFNTNQMKHKPPSVKGKYIRKINKKSWLQSVFGG